MKLFLSGQRKQVRLPFQLFSTLIITCGISVILSVSFSQLFTDKTSGDFWINSLIYCFSICFILVGYIQYQQATARTALNLKQQLRTCKSLNQQLSCESRLANALFNTRPGTLITDMQGKIIRVNHSYLQTTGYTAEELIGKRPHELSSGLHINKKINAEMWKAVSQTGFWAGEIWEKHKNGEIHPKLLTLTAIKDESGRISHYLGSYQDQHINKQTAEEIERLAFYDPLTNLPNRRLLQERLKLAMVKSQRNRQQAALIFIDLDNFKILNDTLGHDMGDLLLKQVAERLINCIREGDTVARLGGDEFIIILENLHTLTLAASQYAEIICHKIQATLRQPYLLKHYEYRCTPSMGATLFTGHEQRMEELLKQADIAMYQAKNKGRNAVCFFDPQMQANINSRVKLEEELRIAVKNQQFVLYFQPQVQHDNRVVGAEVLIRWHHPVRGILTPPEFIPLMEENGSILCLSNWILETACQHLKDWEQIDPSLQLAINVSALQFRQPDFVSKFCEVINRHGINPTQIKLELTEALVVENIENTQHIMQELRKIGISFAIDNFGTGYSSLANLKILPLDQLKIDLSFVQDILVDPNDTVIVKTIIAMANHLGMEVIAEGVETEMQRELLNQLDCKTCQGFLFSKPLSAENFTSYLHTQIAQQIINF